MKTRRRQRSLKSRDTSRGTSSQTPSVGDGWDGIIGAAPHYGLETARWMAMQEEAATRLETTAYRRVDGSSDRPDYLRACSLLLGVQCFMQIVTETVSALNNMCTDRWTLDTA